VVLLALLVAPQEQEQEQEQQPEQQLAVSQQPQ
jgi:hypothetical protein